jgi:hypothetical protein
MFTTVPEADALDWDEVRSELAAEVTYWVVPRSPEGPPHPRPVWGVWLDDGLHLSIGSPVVRRQLDADPAVTVHTASGTEVVVVEGVSAGAAPDPTPALDAYRRKYDWDYDADQFGPLTWVRPRDVLAWHAAGEAGRDGFRRVGRWHFD